MCMQKRGWLYSGMCIMRPGARDLRVKKHLLLLQENLRRNALFSFLSRTTIYSIASRLFLALSFARDSVAKPL